MPSATDSIAFGRRSPEEIREGSGCSSGSGLATVRTPGARAEYRERVLADLERSTRNNDRLRWNHALEVKTPVVQRRQPPGGGKQLAESDRGGEHLAEELTLCCSRSRNLPPAPPERRRRTSSRRSSQMIGVSMFPCCWVSAIRRGFGRPGIARTAGARGACPRPPGGGDTKRVVEVKSADEIGPPARSFETFKEKTLASSGWRRKRKDRGGETGGGRKRLAHFEAGRRPGALRRKHHRDSCPRGDRSCSPPRRR